MRGVLIPMNVEIKRFNSELCYCLFFNTLVLSFHLSKDEMKYPNNLYIYIINWSSNYFYSLVLLLYKIN